MKCKATDNCENESEYEFMGIKSCGNCLHDYWLMNEIGETESYEDFINYSCEKLKEVKK